jgi:hypothetical protein
MGIPTRFTVGPSSGTHTASPSASRLGIYMYAGGGGGANTGPGETGQPGGVGGFGFYNKPITQPFAQPFAVGAGGGANASGGATNVANVGTTNGGTGGSVPTQGSAGNAPGASLTYPSRSFIVGRTAGPVTTGLGNGFGNAGTGGQGGPENFGSGGAGTPGVLVIFENIGT